MRTRNIIALGAVAATLATTASATTLKKLTFREQAKEAELAVLGTAIGTTTEIEDGAVFTLTTFEVAGVAFGNAPQRITVRTAGGSRPNTRLRVSETVAGSPTFLQGSTNLLLLDETDGEYEIVGFNQGMFGVADRDGEKRVLFPEDKGGSVTVDRAFSILNEERSAPDAEIEQ